ncbi:hypothetical protein HBI94_088540 [Parastagonospora nodorum]|nr:hypothetical protein HBI94_088540 [Parastagonospora nodorum]
MDVSALLNPSCDEQHSYRGRNPSPHAAVPYSEPQTALPKRQKIAKDAPIFSEGNHTIGYVNYPPDEGDGDQDLRAEHERFQVFPLGEIRRKGVRHIPCNSDKKDFLDKTGRDAFEMFQYTFKIPGEEKEYVVVWDYNVGLVRMTPFFKSCKYTKTVPAKAMNQNPGLKDVSYSITGGALVCQGYWMPYDAAKAIAATFCYDIRFALTPVFGQDFPSQCLSREQPGFSKFVIDPVIVRNCIAETDRFRREGTSYRLMASASASPTIPTQMNFDSPSWKPKTMKQRRTRPADIESGYGTDTSKRDTYAFSPHKSPGWTHLNALSSHRSPQWTHLNGRLSPNSLSPKISPRSQWTALNRSPSPPTPSVNSAAFGSSTAWQGSPLLQMPTPTPDDHYGEQIRTKRTHSKVALSEAASDEAPVRPQTSGAVNSDHRTTDSIREIVPSKGDIELAELLLSLGSVGRMLLPPTKRMRRGSTM